MHIPKYRHFAARDKGFVEHAGKRTYFPGKFNSPESVASYAKFLESISESDTKMAKNRTRLTSEPHGATMCRSVFWSPNFSAGPKGTTSKTAGQPEPTSGFEARSRRS